MELIRVPDELSPRGGLIRGTRRPPNWLPSGPPPRLPPVDERAALWPAVGEDLCMLVGEWRLLQRTDGHRFSLDDLVTAWYAARVVTDAGAMNMTPPARILDQGCGIGTVLLMMAWRFPEARVVGIEAQPLSAGLARRSLAWNGIEDRCVVLDGDLREPLPDHPWSGAPFDLITGTPPYFPIGTGVESDRVQRGPCRFEHRGGIEAYCDGAAARLAPGGVFVACAAAPQAERVRAAATAAGLRIERWRDVIPRAGKAPLVSLFSMRAALADAPPQPTTVEPALIVRQSDGRRTDEFVALRADMGMPP